MIKPRREGLGRVGIAALFLFAFVAAALATHLLRPVSVRLGLVDHPDGERKLHDTAIPLTGGLGVLVGLAAAGAVALHVLGGDWGERFGALLLAALPLLVAGLWDDYAGSSVRLRFVAQVASALIVVLVGDVVIRDLGHLAGGGRVLLDAWAVPLTVVCVVGAINAFNMLDGLDGLAGGTALVALAWYAIVAASHGMVFEMVLAYLAIGALGGFLVFNIRNPFRRRASVFLGDTGSMLLGLLLVWLAISVTQPAQSTFPPMMSVWVLGLPLLDTLSVMVIRIAQGRSPVSPDRNHLHHRLLALGFDERRTVVILLLAALGFGAIGVGAWQLRVPEAVLFYGAFAVYGAYLAYVTRESWRRWVTRVRSRASST